MPSTEIVTGRVSSRLAGSRTTLVVGLRSAVQLGRVLLRYVTVVIVTVCGPVPVTTLGSRGQLPLP